MSLEPARTRTYEWEDPMIGAAAARTMSGMDYLNAMLRGEIPRPPISHTMDFTLESCAEGRAVFTVTPSEFHYNPIGMVHGGLAATLLDSGLGCAIHTTLPQASVIPRWTPSQSGARHHQRQWHTARGSRDYPSWPDDGHRAGPLEGDRRQAVCTWHNHLHDFPARLTGYYCPFHRLRCLIPAGGVLESIA